MAAVEDRPGGVRAAGEGVAPSSGPPKHDGRGTRTYAVVAGVLFIVATVASLLSQPFLAPVSSADYLVDVAAHHAEVSTGALLGLVARACVGGHRGRAVPDPAKV